LRGFRLRGRSPPLPQPDPMMGDNEMKWFRGRKKKVQQHAESGALVVKVKVDGYDELVEQIQEMGRLVDELTDKLERLDVAAEPISVTHNHYNLHVSTSEAEECQP
jgi:hypothetical protein